MRATTVLFLIVICCFACNKDDEAKSLSCIDDYPSSSFSQCDEVTSEVCDLIIIDEKLLSLSVKESFPDFCQETTSIISFENVDNETMEFTIGERETFQGSFVKGTLDTIPGCQAFCMNTETAMIHFESESIKLYYSLRTELEDGFESLSNFDGAVQTVLRLYQSRPQNSGSLHVPVLTIPVENFSDEAIPIDTTKLLFYPELELNQRMFSNVISQTVFTSDFIKAYFTYDLGLIAFEDEQQVLWVRR